MANPSNEKLTYKMTVEEALIHHKAGEKLYLGDYNKKVIDPEEREKCAKNEMEIVNAIIKHEIANGGLIIENGIYKKTDKFFHVPHHRMKSNPSTLSNNSFRSMI
jgi:hypothetical protein